MLHFRLLIARLRRQVRAVVGLLLMAALLAGCSSVGRQRADVQSAEPVVQSEPEPAPAPAPGSAPARASAPESGPVSIRKSTHVRVPGEGPSVAQVDRIALLPQTLRETSGLALVQGRLWTINDSGDDAVIYGLSADAKAVDKRLYLAGADNVDWESMALDAHSLYIADCGNNRGNRARLGVYAVERDALSAPDGSRVPYRYSTFSYGHRLEVTSSDSHNFDCEAVTAVEDELWLFSKNRADGNSELYRLDPKALHQAVFPFASYPVKGLITAADYDPLSGRLALLGYSRERLFGHSFLWLIPVTVNADGQNQRANKAPDWSGARQYRLSVYAQWEAISWDGAGRLLLTAERSPLSDTMLGEIRLDSTGEPQRPVSGDDDRSRW